MVPSDFFSRLADSWLIKKIPSEGLMALEKKAELMKPKPGQVIFLEGVCAPDFYYILSGSCFLWKAWPRVAVDNMITIANWQHYSRFDSLLTAGHCFGGMSCLSGTRRATTAVTSKEEPTQLIRIMREDFVEIGFLYPQFFLNVIEELSRRAAAAREIEHALVHKGKEAHLIDHLLILARESEGDTDSPYVEFTASDQVSRTLDISKSHINTTLQHLDALGIIIAEYHGRRIILDKLAMYSDGEYSLQTNTLKTYLKLKPRLVISP